MIRRSAHTSYQRIDFYRFSVATRRYKEENRSLFTVGRTSEEHNHDPAEGKTLL